jgi:hypothetical protein
LPSDRGALSQSLAKDFNSAGGPDVLVCLHAAPKLPEVLEPRISVNFQSSMQAGRQRKLAER